ncbi:uncharacterized protein LOC110725436 [Chenopodium quinoa]|uniref:uncharacterized protein LOC110725436 n=1 Tax=Chenopodium quinoa TaxID=63459 RepID=UPI000B7834A0|nr:uncharacterized protein LOC110725436 [Chenopodium quinoa]
MTTYVRERLDKFLADDGWVSLFPDYEAQNFPIYSSDHAPTMLSVKKKDESKARSKSFRFEPLWLSREECGEIVDRSWNTSLAVNINQKIARCGEDLSSWAGKTFGSIKKKIKKVEQKLRELKEGAMDGTTLELCKLLSEELDSLYLQEESLTLANKLKGFLGDVISQNQIAFVPKLLITDNAIVAFEIFHAMKRDGEGKEGNIAMKLDMKRGGEGKEGNIAMKLDMSKAYDCVEWVFLGKVMEKMGFSGAWINRIMDCLESVNFSFKINGHISGSITPSRGLRQGDPISPANVQECSAIADIISKYERASGQKVNLSKTEVTFNKKVRTVRREEIIEILGVQEVERHEKYLVLPTIIGRSKKVIFAGLKERLWKKLQGWKEKLLSRPGKEILIKAVAQAIPTYMMSILKIPDTLIDYFHSLLAKFWWGSNDTTRKMHWQRCDLLCQPKGNGGLGFRDLRCFNRALLAKQFWRLHHNTGSLLHSVLKAKYFKSGDVLTANVGFDPSYAWRSMWCAKSLLLEGLKWRVGNGSAINVWSDAWLPGNTSSLVPTPSVDSDMDLRVIDLIDHSCNYWNFEAVTNTFIAEERALVLSIPLSNRNMIDSMFWWPNKNGEYSVRSGYWLCKNGGYFDMGDIWEKVWKVIWNLKTPLKLRHFLWRAYKGFLAVREILIYRHVIDGKMCAICGNGDESVLHAMFECSATNEIWNTSTSRT